VSHPELADAVDMHIELLELHRRVQGRVALPWFELNEAVIRTHNDTGEPLLRFQDIVSSQVICASSFDKSPTCCGATARSTMPTINGFRRSDAT
jgi:hypothetical protein